MPKKKRRSSVQSGQPSYELYSLGWKAFQHLCVSLVSEMWGQTVQGFFDTHDGGRDGAFHGTWHKKKSETYSGSFTVQCKSSINSNSSLRLSALRDELDKARRLAQRGLCDNYFLFTSGRLHGKEDEDIRQAFLSIPGIKTFAAYGVDRISQLIAESPRLRMLVPRIYGLGDLSQILDERAYSQATDILSSLGDDLEKFVITNSYRKAQKALVNQGIVLLLGEPACGKSTIAAALALGALDEWGCSTIKARDADDFVRHWNPKEPKQFFWIDDAFGATQFDWQSTVRWNGALAHVQAALSRGARFVFTSRTYIYRSARNHLKESALPLIRDSQVVIEVRDISAEEKQQITYNHVRLGTQSADFKSELKPHLDRVAAHENFGPEIARRLGNPLFTQKLSLNSGSLEKFVAEPMDQLREVIETLDIHSRAALALVFMRGGNLKSPLKISASERDALSLLGSALGPVREALTALADSLLLRVSVSGEYYWRFKHPTIRDAFGALLIENPDLLDIYLAGTPADQLFREISCGDVGLQGVKVIVTSDRFAFVQERIKSHFNARAEHKSSVHYFLSNRCTVEFLESFIDENPDFLPSLQMGAYFYAVSDVALIARLNTLGLLPEGERLRHISAAKSLAISIPDAGIFDTDVRGLFRDDEIDDLVNHIRTELIENLPTMVEQWRDNKYDDNETPEDHFRPLVSTMNEFKSTFVQVDDDGALDMIEEGLKLIETTIEAMNQEMPPDIDRDDYVASESASSDDVTDRSIFDDVDAT